jgi:hypothetical protein
MLAAVWLTTVTAPAIAQKQGPTEKYRARAFNPNGVAKKLDIVIYDWTTPEERQALLDTFVEGGSQALYNALGRESGKGYLKLPQSLAYDLQYAWQFEHEGRRRIVLASDRPTGFLELVHNTRSTDYNVSLVVLDLDPETGKGEGSVTGGAELSIDRETGRLEIKFAGTQPARLTKVRPQKIK